MAALARRHRGQRRRLHLQLVAGRFRLALPATGAGSRSARLRWSGRKAGIDRWGQPSLLLAWLPGVGDAFTVAAGVMRVPLLTFLIMVTIAKGARYAAILGAGARPGYLQLVLRPGIGWRQKILAGEPLTRTLASVKGFTFVTRE